MRTFVVASVLLAQASSCQPTGDVGYVEIRTVPTFSNVIGPSLYLDAFKVEPSKKGTTILTQRVGTTRLATDGAGGQLTLCEIVVKKNRITTVTISVLERPPRCQCRNGGGPSRACLS
jgi:hypothetical protein